jgi:hypothetical protein
LIGESPSRSTTTIAYNDNVQREDTLNGDLPMIPFTIIQQATNYFSLSSKLGEGGFGPVYKVWMNGSTSQGSYTYITFLQNWDISDLFNLYSIFC